MKTPDTIRIGSYADSVDIFKDKQVVSVCFGKDRQRWQDYRMNITSRCNIGKNGKMVVTSAVLEKVR